MRITREVMPKKIDYDGKKIGRVNVISLALRVSGGSKWNCICDCGNKFICWSASFKRGSRFECRNCTFERKRGIDLTGRKFGRWTVLNRQLDNKNKTVWNCKCDCGNTGLIATYSLGRKGKSMSCGCLGRKLKSKHINTTLYPPKHGLSKSKFYAMKTSLIHKCYNEKHISYEKFGAKGITICDLWRNGAKDMYKWAISSGWQEGDVFCLKDGEKEFNPETTFIIKENEFRSIIALKGGIQITYKGEIHSILKWAKLMNICPMSLRKRLQKNPSIEEVFSSKFKKMIFFNNENLVKEVIELYKSGMRQHELAKKFNCTASTIHYHLIQNDIQIRSDDMKKIKKPHVKKEDIQKGLDEGKSIKQISIDLGCSWPTIKRRIGVIK